MRKRTIRLGLLILIIVFSFRSAEVRGSCNASDNSGAFFMTSAMFLPGFALGLLFTAPAMVRILGGSVGKPIAYWPGVGWTAIGILAGWGGSAIAHYSICSEFFSGIGPLLFPLGGGLLAAVLYGVFSSPQYRAGPTRTDANAAIILGGLATITGTILLIAIPPSIFWAFIAPFTLYNGIFMGSGIYFLIRRKKKNFLPSSAPIFRLSASRQNTRSKPTTKRSLHPVKCQPRNPKIIDGKEHGEKWRCWPNGKWRKVENWKSGLRHGTWFWWYANGKKIEEGTFYNNERHGTWILWWNNGKKKWQRSYFNGEIHGKATWWYPNGVKRKERVYSSQPRKRPQ